MKRLMTLGLPAVALMGLFAQPAAGQASAEVALGTAVVDRMIEGEADEFSPEIGTLFLWSRVSGAEGTTIQHVWIHGPHEDTVELTIGGSPWRTWSSRNIPPEWTGEWRVEVRDAQGTVLDTVRFMIS
ncbi:MAG: DUF2914 domain-containing protein [Gemmatimonadota bacterium]